MNHFFLMNRRETAKHEGLFLPKEKWGSLNRKMEKIVNKEKKNDEKITNEGEKNLPPPSIRVCWG